jgi:hypothetical protein
LGGTYDPERRGTVAHGGEPVGSTLQTVLEAWRAAERELAALPPDDARRSDAERDVEALRFLYSQTIEQARVAAGARLDPPVDRDPPDG